eukprot:CAMPEP_0204551372 /NCGR_PEP_ID=MMETSP0661-20131031/25833_1 /ASSEMBLY_ACC=CAM_ASM_000606 /TAXON_ID=109239 /ORGANISM="Alexandrium margalefi, Strain AMGDE01CS-322" /LENGTH=53 /DNA_ID=CAMNT_0051558369 /DNA_START=8 /DNA_END=169 /DNA_ORIENTATION=-
MASLQELRKRGIFDHEERHEGVKQPKAADDAEDTFEDVSEEASRCRAHEQEQP